MNPFSRYHRQVLLPQIGPEGQRRISASSVAVVGIGALGSVSANLLARAGVGRLRLIDRDFLELQNLQRQVLFDEDDLRENLPKAVAAQRKLQKINSEIEIKAYPADLNPETIDELLEGIELVLDGTDNFETRFLLNDFSLREKIPWIYAGAVGTEGVAYVIFPGEGACLRCLFQEAPRTGTFQTCDTAGILAPVAHWIASFQAMEALKILSGNRENVDRRLWKIDAWKQNFKTVDVVVSPPPTLSPSAKRLGGSASGGRGGEPACRPGRGGGEGERCSGCLRGEYPYLEREKGSRTVTLCGRNAVQILRSQVSHIDFKSLAQRLTAAGKVRYNDYLLKVDISPFEITIFSNGRAIIQGTEDAAQAKSVYAKYIGT